MSRSPREDRESQLVEPMRQVVRNHPLGAQWVITLSCGCEVVRAMPGRIGEVRECPYCPLERQGRAS